MRITPINSTIINSKFKRKRENVNSSNRSQNFTQTVAERIARLKGMDITDYFARQIAELPEDQYDRAIESLQYGLYEEYVKEIVSLEEEKYKKALALMQKGITDENLQGLASLKRKKYNKAVSLYEKGIDTPDIRYFINLSKRKEKKAIEDMQQGKPPYIAANLARLNMHQAQTAIQLLTLKVVPEDAFRIAKLDKKTQKKCLELIKQGINSEYVIEIAQLKKRNAKKINSLMQLNIGDINIADFANFTEEQNQRAMSLLNKGVFADYIPDILNIESGENKNKQYKQFKQEGFGENASFSMSLMDKQEQDKIKEFIQKNPNIKPLMQDNYDIELVNIRDTNEYILILNKEVTCSNGTKISFIYIVDNNGNITRHKLEEYSNHATSSRIFKKSDIFNIKYGKYGDIREMTQFIQEKDGKGIKGVLHSKASELLPGCFETVYYDINDFKQSNDIEKVNMDIEQSVKNSGIPISTVRQNSDGSITYNENWEYNNFITQRNYSEKKDKNDNILFSEYSYQIKDKSGNVILNIERAFERDKDGNTLNSINGIEYSLKYNDEEKSIIISDGKQTKKLEFKNKLPYYSQDVLWRSIKNLPVDTLLTIYKNITKWKYCLNTDSAANGISKTISTGTDTSIITHETGHLKAFEDETILPNKDLNDIYMKEMTEFQKIIPYNEQEFIEYFSPLSALCDSDGLNEMIAETNILLSSYGVAYDELRTRSQILERYFPQTISKIAELTGKNSSLNLLNQI